MVAIWVLIVAVFLSGSAGFIWASLMSVAYEAECKELQMEMDARMRETQIVFTKEQINKIIALQKQEGFCTVQDAVESAVDSCLKD